MKRNFLLLFVSLILSLAAAEVICRIKGVYLSYNERTGAGGYVSPFEVDARDSTRTYSAYEKRFLKRSEFTDSFTTNENGLKEKAITLYDAKKRILILGDSYTEGVGAPADSSYPRLLEKMLPDTFEIINAGIGGSDIFFEFKLLQSLNQKYRPDIVIVTCNSSDIMEYMVRGGFERFLPNGTLLYRKAPWFESLYAHSLLVRLLMHDMFNYDFNFIKKSNVIQEQQIAAKQMCTAIDTIRKFCTLNGIKVGIVFHPFYTDIIHPENYNLKTLMVHATITGVPYTDELLFLQAAGVSRNNWQNIYWPIDGHFNPQGYQLLAKCVYQWLQVQGWISYKSLSTDRLYGFITA